jgi:four helix bundle protein
MRSRRYAASATPRRLRHRANGNLARLAIFKSTKKRNARLDSFLPHSEGMPKITSYRDLVAWQRAMELVELVYRVTEPFPTRERYGLAFEMRRSAVSIPSNIAEGHSQRRRAYARYLVISIGSHSELSTQAEISFRLKYIVSDERLRLAALLGEVGRLTQGLLNSVQTLPVP